jgi:hypothetical protein
MWNPAVANTATTSAWPSATAISAADASPPAATAFPERQYTRYGGSAFRRAHVHYAFSLILAVQRREKRMKIESCIFTGQVDMTV